MNADQNINLVTEAIIACAYRVSNTLGVGFLEKVYENALTLELHRSGHAATQQCPMKVMYQGQVVGDYIADLIVNDCVIVEIKSIKRLEQIHVAQGLNYLKATGLQLCLLINFGTPKVEIKRIIHGV